MADITIDTATQANYSEVSTDNVTFDWVVDFDAKVLSGSATHHMIIKKDGVQEAMWAFFYFRKWSIFKLSSALIQQI